MQFYFSFAPNTLFYVSSNTFCKNKQKVENVIAVVRFWLCAAAKYEQ